MEATEPTWITKVLGNVSWGLAMQLSGDLEDNLGLVEKPWLTTDLEMEKLECSC